MFAQKKPRVWPRFILGFQGNFPSSDSMGEFARTSAPYLAGQKVNLALSQMVSFGSKTNLLGSHLLGQEMWEEIAIFTLCLSTVILLLPHHWSYHSWPRAGLSSTLHLDLTIQPWLGHLTLTLCPSGLYNPNCDPWVPTSSSDPPPLQNLKLQHSQSQDPS